MTLLKPLLLSTLLVFWSCKNKPELAQLLETPKYSYIDNKLLSNQEIPENICAIIEKTYKIFPYATHKTLFLTSWTWIEDIAKQLHWSDQGAYNPKSNTVQIYPQDDGILEEWNLDYFEKKIYHEFIHAYHQKIMQQHPEIAKNIELFYNEVMNIANVSKDLSYIKHLSESDQEKEMQKIFDNAVLSCFDESTYNVIHDAYGHPHDNDEELLASMSTVLYFHAWEVAKRINDLPHHERALLVKELKKMFDQVKSCDAEICKQLFPNNELILNEVSY